MAKLTPDNAPAAQQDLAKFFKDPGRVFYRVAVDDLLTRGKPAELRAFVNELKAIELKHGDIKRLIAKADIAAKRVG